MNTPITWRWGQTRYGCKISRFFCLILLLPIADKQRLVPQNSGLQNIAYLYGPAILGVGFSRKREGSVSYSTHITS
jgi:hypothetical protein